MTFETHKLNVVKVGGWEVGFAIVNVPVALGPTQRTCDNKVPGASRTS